VAPGIDWPVVVAARIAARLRLPHPISPAAAQLATSKLRQRERFAQCGVPQPRWQVVTGRDDDPGLGFPCVVKAPDRQGQRGLSLVRSPEELGPAIAAALEASRSRVCLVEELVDGPEATVVAWSVEGELKPAVVTDRVLAEPPAFGVALAHVWPATVDAGAAASVAAHAASALGIQNGPTYTQVRFGPQGPVVVELAARLGGGHDAELCFAARGIDLNGAALAAALGDPALVQSRRQRERAACTLFLLAPEGELVSVAGEEEARALPGIVDVHVYRRPRYRFGPLRIGADRAGAVLAVGRRRSQAVERARAAAALVRFEMVPAESLV
jgi:biotin carboxylase